MGEETRRSVENLCREFGIAKLELFGSRARGDSRDESDYDFLYTRAEGARLGFALERFSQELERILNAPVDLIAHDAVHPLLREQIHREAQPF